MVGRPNMRVPYYLMLSYLYYATDRSLVSDHVFDIMCKSLLRDWDSITHQHKHLIDRDSLAAGTGYYLTYTNQIKGGAEALWAMFHPNKRGRR